MLECWQSRNGKLNKKRGPFSGTGGFRPDFSIVRLNNLPREIKPKAAWMQVEDFAIQGNIIK